ncbi:GPI biosynthesis protein family Pig-F-domain-containing protein [Roridomyces roridus]|uniref:GPI biosynthesis protein family Pig-F-domain-containing protein n=1 Tax=Roridomyces roridus TaxID=1738132 RepID=A0AAD7FAA6_9AGAR|nr:GPI biosynthesis protein family Pig-F-domain-containing protein [Roridomyces roridus]
MVDEIYGGGPDVAKEDRDDDTEPFATDQHPASHRIRVPMAAGGEAVPAIADDELDQLRREHERREEINGDGEPIGQTSSSHLTSIVGVHITLLGFTALFLPRTTDVPILEFLKPTIDESQLTSRDRPQHPFLDALTQSPATTLAWICIGTVVPQGWWGGWVRSWSIDLALQNAGIQPAALESRKLAHLASAGLQQPSFQPLLHRHRPPRSPLVTHTSQTALLAILLALLVVFPPAYTYGAPMTAEITAVWIRIFAEFTIRTPIERALLYSAVGTLVGAWLGTIPIALDWDRPWQAWPLTPAFGAILGYILASLGALTVSAIHFSAAEHLRSPSAKIKTIDTPMEEQDAERVGLNELLLASCREQRLPSCGEKEKSRCSFAPLGVRKSFLARSQVMGKLHVFDGEILGYRAEAIALGREVLLENRLLARTGWPSETYKYLDAIGLSHSSYLDLFRWWNWLVSGND